MTTSMSQLSKTAVILITQKDWKEWLFGIEHVARGGGVWELVDPALDTEPVQPSEPTPVTLSDVNPAATSINDLTEPQFERYRFLKTEYKIELGIYREKRLALKDVTTRVIDSVSRTNLTFIQTCKTTYAMLRALQKRLAPTDRARKIDCIRLYQGLKKPPKAQNVDQWLHQWETIYTDAAELNLAEVQEERPLLDFLAALKGVDPDYGNIRHIEATDAVESNKELPTVYDAIEKFRNYRRLIQASNPTGKASHSAFATFQGDQPPAEASSDGCKSLKCPCGLDHRFGQCLYVIESLRPAGWIPDPEIQKKFEDRMQSSPKFKNALKAAQKAANKDKDKDKDKDKNKDKDKKSNDSKEGSELASFATAFVAEAPHASYKLKDCWTLDGAADTHVCNDPLDPDFEITRKASKRDIILGGKQAYQIEAFGTAYITVDGPDGPQQVALLETALVPGYLTNCVALSKLTKKHVHWDTGRGVLYHQDTRKTFCYVKPLDGHWILQHRPSVKSAFPTSSRKPRPKKEASAFKWHTIMGHAGKEAIEHLQEATQGVVFNDDTPAPYTIDCEACSVSKAHEIISRRTEHEHPSTTPFHRVAYDLIQMTRGYNGDEWISHFYCTYSKMNFVYTHRRKGQATEIVREFLNLIENQYGKKVKFFRVDGERSLGGEFDNEMADRGITTERTAPNTPAQNGPAERSGGVMIIKARAMSINGHLPTSLWPESIKAAGYIENRTPIRDLGWKTPYEIVHGEKPVLSHMIVYASRAYPLRHKIPKKHKLEPRAHIGYLVGYDSTNIYRIWIPSHHEVVRTRDVTFNEELFYDPKELDLGHILRESTSEIVEILDVPPSITQQPAIESDIDDYDDIEASPSLRTSTDVEETQTSSTETLSKDAHLPTPSPSHDSPIGSSRDSTPEAHNTAPRASEVGADITASYILPEGSRRSQKAIRRSAHAAALEKTSELSGFYAGFATGLQKDLRPKLFHRDTLPPEPKSWKQMLNHPHAAGFKLAAKKEKHDLEKRQTFQYVQKDTIGSKQVLPLLWVFKYKFDTDGYLIKYKARLCVRGDLQTTDQETYAATLAARTLRALMAITAAFGLEKRQYDIVNAFVNSKLTEEVYCYCPEGFECPGMIILLLRALYGLKTSPLLWYRDFTNALEELGLNPVPDVNCLYANDHLIVFFYVDDIVVLCTEKNLDKLHKFESSLFDKFEMRSLGDLKWFLGIRVVHDRSARKIWLCQDSYIEKIAAKFNLEHSTFPKTPLPTVELQPYDETATPSQVYAYQQRVGSLNFAAVITRPDISKAVSKLSEFLRNPSPTHLSYADRVISYLYGTRTWAIEYSGAIRDALVFFGASDAAFADDMETRYSSYGYLFQLYNGVIDWKASKQTFVVTSTTQAELGAVSAAGKEIIWWDRLFKAIGFDTGHDLKLLCDNQQTVRLLKKETPKLNTKLRHVDIHQCWLRQEVQAKRFDISWVPTDEMPADGLTKILPAQKHKIFVSQLNLKDIQDILSAESSKLGTQASQ